ncbi:MAG TPA: hypothetical protein VLL98_00425 [Rickettsiales bacterium]|nr:hypothetical protein [Rickettsiales bacterium]
MSKLKILKIYNNIYYILVFLIFLCIIKFISDFYSKNKNVIKNKNNVVQYQNIIIKPQLQFNDNGFQFVEAEQGIETEGNYIFTNVYTYGDFGKASAEKLEVMDKQNILEFTGNPKFTIYINKIK